MRTVRSRTVALLLLALGPDRFARAESPLAAKGLTAVTGIKVGQVTLKSRPTGCTVVLAKGAPPPAWTCAGVRRERGRPTCSIR